MIYLESLKLVNQTFPGTHVLPLNVDFKFSEVNLFVGNQGCGKSTMLHLIQKNSSDIEVTLSKECIKNGVDTFYFDSEKDNPRVKDPRDYTNANGTNKGIGFGSGLASRFKSHGEILEHFTITPIKKAKDCVIILDEPESGLSITNQFRLIEAIKGAVKRGCQFFIATHCFPLIQSFDVISLEHTENMSGKEFIKRVKNSI